ncbi:MAG: phosphonate transporter ATP-binding protein [Actinomycetota bacterium]
MTRIAAIKVRNLGKSYPGGATALQQLSFEVAAGQVIALVGKSGSGKSTLLRCLNRTIAPTEGQVEVLGQQLADLGPNDLRKLRSKIGLIMQQFALVGRLSAMENVLAGALASLRGPRIGLGMFPEPVRERALAQLSRVGLLNQVYQRADTLSGGQMQRVAIARALMQEPQILLADEPVSSLDPESSSAILRLLRELADERNLTVIAAMHQFDQAQQFSDRMLGLLAGRLVIDEPSQKITKRHAQELYLSES